jgi:hypothetical protein
VSTAVRVNVTTYSHTYVATNLLRSLKQLIKGCGLSTAELIGDWAVLELGVSTWLESRHLTGLVLEVLDLSKQGNDLVGRFDFDIDYGYYPGGDGDLWLDPDTVEFVIRKNGSYPSRCTYRVIADTTPGYPAVTGWSTTSFRSTAGFVRQTAGTAIGGGSLGASLAYYARTGS